MQRLYWIDNLKTFAIFFVVLGHFMCSYRSFIYTFHMPLFLLISGYLYKNRSMSNELKNSALCLFLPYIFYCLVGSGFSYYYKEFNTQESLYSIIGLLEKSKYYVCPLWYLLALFLIRILHSWLKKYAFLFIFFTTIAFAIIRYYTALYNSFDIFQIFTATLSYPYFFIGTIIKDKQLTNKVHNYNIKSTTVLLVATLVISLYLSTIYGNAGNLFWCEFGPSVFISYAISFAASLSIFFLFVLHCNISNKVTYAISNGTLLIVALHMYFQRFLINHFGASELRYIVYSFIILFALIPIIQLATAYFPLGIGKRRSNMH